MKFLKRFKVFESTYLEIQEIISTLKEICYTFEDEGCTCLISPSNDIEVKLIALQSKNILSSLNIPFYILVDINRKTITSEFGTLPDWFIDECRRIESYMESEGFETKALIRYATDWEYFSSLDELTETTGLIYKVKLEFRPIEVF